MEQLRKKTGTMQHYASLRYPHEIVSYIEEEGFIIDRIQIFSLDLRFKLLLPFGKHIELDVGIRHTIAIHRWQVFSFDNIACELKR